MPRESNEWRESLKFKRAKKVEKSFDELFDEPFLREEDNRTQKQKDKEALEEFNKKYMTDVEETTRKSPKK
tara:strand:- start:910 stop:1122 length:213 start_codon:yes stop_codon:yes gene_type:complete